jgi:sulfide:quinone oxidoreductase
MDRRPQCRLHEHIGTFEAPEPSLYTASSGRWVHVAKVAFEKYFLHEVRAGTTEPYYEKMVMRLLDIGKIKRPAA